MGATEECHALSPSSPSALAPPPPMIAPGPISPVSSREAIEQPLSPPDDAGPATTQGPTPVGGVAEPLALPRGDPHTAPAPASHVSRSSAGAGRRPLPYSPRFITMSRIPGQPADASLSPADSSNDESSSIEVNPSGGLTHMALSTEVSSSAPASTSTTSPSSSSSSSSSSRDTLDSLVAPPAPNPTIIISRPDLRPLAPVAEEGPYPGGSGPQRQPSPGPAGFPASATGGPGSAPLRGKSLTSLLQVTPERQRRASAPSIPLPVISPGAVTIRRGAPGPGAGMSGHLAGPFSPASTTSSSPSASQILTAGTLPMVTAGGSTPEGPASRSASLRSEASLQDLLSQPAPRTKRPFPPPSEPTARLGDLFGLGSWLQACLSSPRPADGPPGPGSRFDRASRPPGPSPSGASGPTVAGLWRLLLAPVLLLRQWALWLGDLLTALLARLRDAIGALLLRWIEEADNRRFLRTAPRRILLVRHGESEANVDPSVYSRTPDSQIGLTERGREQARAAGARLTRLVRMYDRMDERQQEHPAGSADGRHLGLGSGHNELLLFYTSPYERCKQTLQALQEEIPPEWMDFSPRVIEDPRLREQDCGNLQPRSEKAQRALWERRSRLGRFFFRFPDGGESGADVFDRVSLFLESLNRLMRRRGAARPRTIVIVSHGLSIRLFLMRYYRWSVEKFDRAGQLKNAGIVHMELVNGRYELIQGVPHVDPAAGLAGGQQQQQQQRHQTAVGEHAPPDSPIAGPDECPQCGAPAGPDGAECECPPDGGAGDGGAAVAASALEQQHSLLSEHGPGGPMGGGLVARAAGAGSGIDRVPSMASIHDENSLYPPLQERPDGPGDTDEGDNLLRTYSLDTAWWRTRLPAAAGALVSPRPGLGRRRGQPFAFSGGAGSGAGAGSSGTGGLLGPHGEFALSGSASGPLAPGGGSSAVGGMDAGSGPFARRPASGPGPGLVPYAGIFSRQSLRSPTSTGGAAPSSKQD